MKKAINLITIPIVLLTFCVSAFATGNVHDNTTPQPKTGEGVFSCRTIAPLNINVVPASGVSDPSLIFAKSATSQLTYNLLSLGYEQSEMITTFQIIGEPNQFFYSSISVAISNYITLQSDGDGVTLKMNWKYRQGGSGPFLDYNPTISHQLGNAMTIGSYIGLGEFEIRAYYTDVIVDTDAEPGGHIFYQTVTVAYNAGEL